MLFSAGIMLRKFLSILFLACVPVAAAHAVDATHAVAPVPAVDFGPSLIISAHDQKLAVLDKGKVKAKYDISTSKYGLGDTYGSYKTPVGTLWVCNKIGDNLPAGTVIKNRNATGEVVAPNAPGRDPIVSRVIWLRGARRRQRQRLRPLHLHPRHARGKTPRPRRELTAASACGRRISLHSTISCKVGTHVTISDNPFPPCCPGNTCIFPCFHSGATRRSRSEPAMD